MLTFNFNPFLYETRYPDNSNRVQFGKGYVFTSAPTSPPQRIFALNFKGFTNFINSDGTIDTTSYPLWNVALLETFYNSVYMYLSFHWAHPIYGTKIVRFNKPLVITEPLPGGTGVLAPLPIEFIEVI